MSVAAVETARPASLVRDYLELSKARIVVMILITTAAGFAAAPATFGLVTLLHCLIGTALVAGGTNALNEYAERHLDAMMHRTRRRPLPAGRITPRAALLFSVAISVAGVTHLALATNVLAATVAAVTLVTYLFAYTPLKQRSDLCTLVGAVPGALPPMIGWAAATGELGLGAWLLFAIMFLWQLPHFLAISWMHRDDYARANFVMVAVEDPDGRATSMQALLYSVALLPVSLTPYLFLQAGPVYAVGATVAGAAMIYASMRFVASRTIPAARSLFMGSNLYLIAIMVLFVGFTTWR
jgi:heme o synthase